MKRQMFLATAFSAALAVGVAAQTPPQNPPPTGERSQAQQQVTVTGCLAQAPSPSTGATGTAGTATAGSEFILKNATTGSSPSSATGTSGASPSAMGKSYKLVGGSSSDLKEHVNAKVEIRGTIEKPSATSTAPPATTPPATGTAADRDVQTLRVTSVKKIADSCQ